jgi:hypothetical protein
MGRAARASLEEIRRGVPEALLEEPEPLADLVDDARALRADLVGLPEQRDLLPEAALEPQTLARREARVVERRHELGERAVLLEDRPRQRLRRMRRQDELDRDARRCRAQLLFSDSLLVEPEERLVERLASVAPSRSCSWRRRIR